MDEKKERALKDIKELVEAADKYLKRKEPEMKDKIKSKIDEIGENEKSSKLFKLRDDGSCQVIYHDGTQETLDPIKISFKKFEKGEEK